jgi:hypothetical protein
MAGHDGLGDRRGGRPVDVGQALDTSPVSRTGDVHDAVDSAAGFVGLALVTAAGNGHCPDAMARRLRPWPDLRGASFVGQLLDWHHGDVASIPTWPSQLVAARTVAEALVDLATDPDAPAQPAPGAPLPEIAGPHKEIAAEGAKLLGARRGIQVVGADNPDDPGAEAYASGGLLPSPHAKLAGPTFQVTGSTPNPSTGRAGHLAMTSFAGPA